MSNLSVNNDFFDETKCKELMWEIKDKVLSLLTFVMLKNNNNAKSERVESRRL